VSWSARSLRRKPLCIREVAPPPGGRAPRHDRGGRPIRDIPARDARRASLARRVDERRSRTPRQAEAPVKRGSAYWINLEASSPPELGKVRPGIVVSNSFQNERLRLGGHRSALEPRSRDMAVAVPCRTARDEGVVRRHPRDPPGEQVEALGLHRRDSSRGDGADRRRARNLSRRPKRVAASAWRKRDAATGKGSQRRLSPRPAAW